MVILSILLTKTVTIYIKKLKITEQSNLSLIFALPKCNRNRNLYTQFVIDGFVNEIMNIGAK